MPKYWVYVPVNATLPILVERDTEIEAIAVAEKVAGILSSDAPELSGGEGFLAVGKVAIDEKTETYTEEED